MAVGDVAGAVIRHHRPDLDAALGEPGDRTAQEGNRALRGKACEHFRVGEARMIIDHHVHVFKARRSVPFPSTDRSNWLLRWPTTRWPAPSTEMRPSCLMSTCTS